MIIVIIIRHVLYSRWYPSPLEEGLDLTDRGTLRLLYVIE